MPDRTGHQKRAGGKPQGCYRIDRVFRGVGRVRVTSGTASLREYHRRNDALTRLYEDGRLDVLAAVQCGTVTVLEAVSAYHLGAAHSVASIALVAPLWTAIEATLPKMGKSIETRDRYELSLNTLRTSKVISASAKVRDLALVDWERVRPFYKSAADWNRMRSALSVFISRHVGDMMHPFRRQVTNRIAREQEEEVVTDVSVEKMLEAVALAPEWARAPLLLLALTGVRFGEYLYADETDLRPLSREWVVRGKSGHRIVSVSEAAWPIIAAAVPPRYAPPPEKGEKNGETQRYQRLAGAWKRATRKAGVHCNLHALRHLAGQLVSDAGMTDQLIRHFLGHKTTATTGRYTRRTSRREAAEHVADAILRKRA